jgi:hypothetical protein
MFVWTFSDIVTIITIAIAVLLTMGFALKAYVKQSFCKHDGRVRETMACDVICIKCGKNLGFIGTWRKKNKAA